MEQLHLKPEEFEQLLRGFQGGYTHANAKYVQMLLKNVSSYDFTSSYPAVMLLEQFPMSEAHEIHGDLDQSSLTELLHTSCCLFDLEVWDLVPHLHQAHPLSRSKCSIAENYTLDNGRIVAARHIKTTCTEQDFFTYQAFYDFGEWSVSNFIYYDKNYLPRQFSNAIINLYATKTRLKDVPGEEVNYMISKNMMNSAYGMSVTNPVRTELKYENDEFFKIPPNMAEAIETYNNNKRRFLFYPWGVWVTAYARANLFSGIMACGNDFVYSDTDSVKILNRDKHLEYFDRYNETVMRKIENAANAHGHDPDDYSPKNIKGKAKTIGIWDYEGTYDEFKTLGAKRYLVRHGDDYQITLAGANKKKTMEYLLKTGNPFQHFDDNLTIPEEYSGRLTLTYIDDETSGTVTDWNGVPYHYHEYSSVHMEKSKYELTMSDDFREYIRVLKGGLDLE